LYYNLKWKNKNKAFDIYDWGFQIISSFKQNK
jgi:hypothetical protein